MLLQIGILISLGQAAQVFSLLQGSNIGPKVQSNELQDSSCEERRQFYSMNTDFDASSSWDWFNLHSAPDLTSTAVQISSTDNSVDISQSMGGGIAAIWQKQPVDLAGETRFAFYLSLERDDVNLAFVIQKDGLAALGTATQQAKDTLGGAAGIRGCIAAIVFEPATRTIKLIETTSEHGVLTVENSRIIQKASLHELSEAKKLQMEISLSNDPTTGSLGVTVSSNRYRFVHMEASLAARHSQGGNNMMFSSTEKYFIGLTTSAVNTPMNQATQVSFNKVQIGKAHPAAFSMRVEQHLMLGVGHLLRVQGQILLSLKDECLTQTSLINNLSSAEDSFHSLIEMYVEQNGADQESRPQKCEIQPIHDPFSQTNSLYSPVGLKLDFQCDFEEIESEEGKVWIIYQGEDLKPIGNREISLKAPGQSEQNKLSNVVYEGIDLRTGQFKQEAYVDSPYVIKAKAKDLNYLPVKIYADQMRIQISQEQVKRVASSLDGDSYTFTQEVAFECYLTGTGTPCGSEYTANQASEFSLVIVPEHAGTYTVSSPFSARPSLYITVIDGPESAQTEDAPQQQQFLSTKHSYAKLETEATENQAELEAGSTIVLKIVPMSDQNSPIAIGEHCTVADSFYTISDGESGEHRFEFQSIDYSSDANQIILTAFIMHSGTLTMHPWVTCGAASSDEGASKYEYPITCLGHQNEHICQKTIMPLSASSFQVRVQRDHATQESVAALAHAKCESGDARRFFQQGENLAFDVIAVDIFGNQVDDYDLSKVTAKFYYGNKKLKLKAYHMPGVIHFQPGSEDENTIFKALPPRLDYYRVVFGGSPDLSDEVHVNILNLKDQEYPMNICTDGDEQEIEDSLSQVIFDPVGRIGEPIEVRLTLYTDELLRLSVDPSAISVGIYDLDQRSKCTEKVIPDLYPGSYIAQILCQGQSSTTGETLEFLPVLNLPGRQQQQLSSEKLRIQIYEQVATDASPEFYAYEGASFDISETAESHVLLEFGLLDQFSNFVHSTQLAPLGSFNGSTLLDATFTLVYADLDEVIVESRPLPWIDESRILTFKLHGKELPVGQYTLKLQLASEVSPEVTFRLTSSSSLVSPRHTRVALVRPASPFKIGEKLEILLSPANQNSQGFVDLDAVSSQVYCHASNEFDRQVSFSAAEAINSTTIRLTSDQPLTYAGRYSAHCQVFIENFLHDDYLALDQSYMYVRDGLFEVSMEDKAFLEQVEVLMETGGNEWLEMSASQSSFYSEAVHGPYFVFRVQAPQSTGLDDEYAVSAISLIGFTAPDEEWLMQSFTQIDDHTFGIQLPDRVYGGQVLSLTVTVERNGVSHSIRREILTTDRLDQNPSQAAQTEPRIECPQVLTLVAGTPYNMTCFVNQVDMDSLELQSQSIDSFSSSLSQTEAGFLSVALTKEIATVQPDILYLSDNQGARSHQIQIDVVAASLQRLTFNPLNSMAEPGEDLEFEISTPLTAQFMLYDRYDNVIKLKHTSYTGEVLAKLYSVHHEKSDALPVDFTMQVREYDFLVNITTQYTGVLQISSPLFTKQSSYRAHFISKQAPYSHNSYAIVENQSVYAGEYLDLKVFLRDQVGNQDLVALKEYDPEKSTGVQAILYPLEAGRRPTLIKTFYPIAGEDELIHLEPRVQLTEAGYYRLRVQFKDSDELTCSGCVFKVLATPDAFYQARVHDFTHNFSQASAKLLRDEDQPQLSLQFVDSFGNIQNETDFVENIKVSIIDVYSDKLVFSENDPVLLPIAGMACDKAFQLDFCLSSVGIKTACLADIVYGRLKIEDTETGVYQILTLDMVPGRLENYSEITHDYFVAANYLGGDQIALLENMLVESQVEIVDPIPKSIDSFYLEQTEESAEIVIHAVNAQSSTGLVFDILVEKLDPTQLTTIDSSVIRMDESDRDAPGSSTFSKSLSLTQYSGVYLFSAFSDSDKVPIHCRSPSCIVVRRDPASGLIDSRQLFDLQLEEHETSITISFDYEPQADSQEDKLAVVSPAGKIEFTTEKITVLRPQKQVYATIKVTKAHANAIFTLELQDDLYSVDQKTLFFHPRAPAPLLVEASPAITGDPQNPSSSLPLVVISSEALPVLGGKKTRLHPAQVSAYLQLVIDLNTSGGDGTANQEVNLAYSAQTFNLTHVSIDLTDEVEKAIAAGNTLRVYRHSDAQAGGEEIIALQLQAVDEPLDDPEQLLIDASGSVVQMQDAQKAGLYQVASGEPKWWYKPVGPLEVTRVSVMRWRHHEESISSVGQTQPFMVKIWRTDVYGNQAQAGGASTATDVFNYSLTFNGLDIFKLNEMPDGSYLAAIEEREVYNRLPGGVYKIEVTTMNSVMVELGYDEFNLQIVAMGEPEGASAVTSSTFASVEFETLHGLIFKPVLRQGVENQIVLKALDQVGRIYASQPVSYTIKELEQRKATLIKLANEGAFMLCILPDNLSQITLEKLAIQFVSASGESVNVELEYQIQPQVPPIKVTPLFNKHTWLEEGEELHQPYTRIDLDFNLSSAAESSSAEPQMLVNDTQVLERLQVFKNGRLFASGFDNTVRNIQLSSDDLRTFKMPAYLGDEQHQTFELYFVDFANMWHKLFSVTFEVQQATSNKLKLSGKKKARNQRKAKKLGDSSDVSIQLLTTQKNDQVVIFGVETEVTVLLISGDGECLSTPEDFSRDQLQLSINNATAVGTEWFSQNPIVTVFEQQGTDSVCRQRISAKILIQKESLVGQNIEFKAKYKPSGISNSLTFTVVEKAIDFTKTKVGWMTTNESQPASIVANIETSTVFNYRLNFYDQQGKRWINAIETPIGIQFDTSQNLSSVTYEISREGLVSVMFTQPGTYFVTGYDFGGQDLHPIAENGPVLFKVQQASCPQVSIDGLDTAFGPSDTISLQLKCLDESGRVLQKQPDPSTISVTFQRQATLTANSPMTSVESSKIRGRVSHGSRGALQTDQVLYQHGSYQIQVHSNNKPVTMSSNNNSLEVTSDTLCVTNAASGSSDIFLCPTTSICTSSYFNCDRIDDTICDTATDERFTCFADSTTCVKNVMTDCCPQTEDPDAQLYCPHTQACVSDASQCCQLDSETPIWCEETQACVSYAYECCSNYLSEANPLVRCEYEDKCVPSDPYCFKPFERDCSDKRFPVLCQNDGVCRRDKDECPSPKVCPPGYTQCPDSTCVEGEGQFGQCDEAVDCYQEIPFSTDSSVVKVEYIRCPDALTCVTSFDDCPTEISCMEDGYVVCPDSSCRANAFECVQPPKDPHDQIDRTTCGPQMMRCPNGQCSDSCDQDHETNVQNCTATGQVLCGRTMTCMDNYQECTVEVYCPKADGYTLSPATFLCGNGPQICVLEREQCQSTACSSQIAYFTPEASSMIPYTDYDTSSLISCPDGRCMVDGNCMTAFQCSSSYIKAGGFGLFCVKTEAEADSAMQIAVKLHSTVCPSGSVQCLGGQCRASVNDCPQDTTCPPSKPIQCQDGQCQTSREACATIDDKIYENLQTCLASNLLLCQSDLTTCSESQDLCPTMTTCPFGFIKCSESQCVDPLTETCPTTSVPCSDSSIGEYYFCRGSGTCVSSGYANCPTMVTCPVARPVKCTSDLSCRESMALCPDTDESTDTNSLNGNLVICTGETPIKCEDGSCRGTESDCNKSSKLEDQVQACLKSKDRYFCYLTSTCVNSLSECASLATTTSPCPTGTVYSHESRSCLSQLGITECQGTDEFVCADGTCQAAPCPEWTECPTGQVQCPTGQCVTDETTCPSSTTGCPVDRPVQCPYQGCFETGTTCEDSETAQTNLSAHCSQLNLVACSFKADCQASVAECATSSSDQCYNYLFPNTIKSSTTGMSSDTCYVPSCPPDYPLKCDNGLCVSDTKYCPAVQSQLSDLDRCSTLSTELSKDLYVPCLDGQCVQSANQCLPAYDCSLNSVDTYRCQDGTCKASQNECAPYQEFCNTDNTVRCPNGMCASVDNQSCISNDNGCPSKLPSRCETNGVCMTSTSSTSTCYSPFDLMSNLQISSDASSTAATSNVCELANKYACYSGNNIVYCADSISSCYLTSNNCPVNSPIYCNGQCLDLTSSCPQPTSPSTNGFSLNDLDKTQESCPWTTPFRCSNLDYFDCKALPYTSYASLAGQSCNSAIQSLDASSSGSTSTNYYMNECVTAVTPFACGDGSCVRTAGECPTCSYFCEILGKCVASEADCVATSSDADLQASLMQLCPNGAPYRCIEDGRCVQSALFCDMRRTMTSAAIYNQTYTGNLIDLNCPFSSPIRCITGACVQNYTGCFSAISNTNSVFMSPIAWGAVPEDSVDDPCQVYCQDGSCRDRQENCPLILGCTDPLRPIRCRSGFCAQSTDDCVTLYGSEVESEAAGQPSAQCQTEEGTSDDKFFRCEDGVCRPAVLNSETGAYDSGCLQYMGCGLELPYQCPSGMCVAKADDCKTYGIVCNSSYNTPYQCKNLQCVSSPQECDKNPALVSPALIEYDLNPAEAVTINFAYQDQVPIARLVLPSGSLSLPETEVSSRGGVAKLRFEPVPLSTLNQITNNVDTAFYPYLSPYFKMNEETGALSNAESLITPQVKILSLNSTVQVFNDGAKIEYYVNATSVDTSILNKTNDFCLALASSDLWSCQQRTPTFLDDGFWSFPITDMGIYSVVINPNEVLPIPDPPEPGPDPPEPGPDDPDDPDDPEEGGSGSEEGFFSKTSTWIILGGSLLLLIIILIVLYCCCRNKRKKDAELALAPAVISDAAIDQINEKEHLLQQSSQSKKKDNLPPSNAQNQYPARHSQSSNQSTDRHHQRIDSQGSNKEKFDMVIEQKKDEIERLEEQLDDLKLEHDRRQLQLDEHATTEQSSKDELSHYKKQLSLKYKNQVRRIAEEAKQEIEAVKAYHESEYKRTKKDHTVAYAINEEELEMDSHDSFDSDQQREIALLDQQWNDLVNEYVGGDQHLIVDEEPRTVLSNSYHDFQSPDKMAFKRAQTYGTDAAKPRGKRNNLKTQQTMVVQKKRPRKTQFDMANNILASSNLRTSSGQKISRQGTGLKGKSSSQAVRQQQLIQEEFEPDSSEESSYFEGQKETSVMLTNFQNLHTEEYEDAYGLRENQQQNRRQGRQAKRYNKRLPRQSKPGWVQYGSEVDFTSESFQSGEDDDDDDDGVYDDTLRRRDGAEEMRYAQKYYRMFTRDDLRKHPPSRLKIRNSLVAFAQGFIDRWEEMADRETRSSKYGFDFVGRQTDYNGLTLTVTKARIPGLTSVQHKIYRENVHNLTQLVDEKITMSQLESFNGCKSYMQEIAMPMFMTNRSIPVLYYYREHRDKSIEFMSSSKGTEEVVRVNQALIGKNVIGNNIVNYTKLTPTKTGYDWVSVLCVDLAGSLPGALQRTAADIQMKSQERVIYLILHGKAPPN